MFPPPAQVYSPPKKDMSWIGLLEFTDDTITDYSRPSLAEESNPNGLQNNSSYVSKIGESTGSILSKPAVKFVKVVDCTEVKTNKVEAARKSSVRYAEMYRRTSKSSKVRGNQRNWNNLKSQQLGENFVMKNKACFNYGQFDHMSYDCDLWVKKGKSSPRNNYTHKSMPPRPATHNSYRPPMRPVRPNVNASQPKRTSFYKPAHSYAQSPFQGKSANRTRFQALSVFTICCCC
nr:ubiquitin hydrolase [Tanacetum cinerariifolium]